MDGAAHPRRVNNAHFTTNQFPEILGFCDRDDQTHVTSVEEETYQYKLGKNIAFTVKKRLAKWEIIMYDDQQSIRHISTGTPLGPALVNALSFRETDRDIQDTKLNILIPVRVQDREKALAIMYYLGGYPTSTMPITAEYLLIKEKFIDPALDFLAYSYVPAQYVSWLRDQLKHAGIIGQNKNMTIWIFKK